MSFNPCGCTQLLEADPAQQFTICDNAGSPAFTEAGLTAIPSGTTFVDVAFATQKASNNLTFIELAIENLVDPNPLLLSADLVSRNKDGFRVELTGQTDSANYKLRWNVYVSSL